MLRDGGTAVINLGFGSGQDRVSKAVKSTLTHPLLDVDMASGKSAMIHVTGSTSMTIEEATTIGAQVTETLNPKANVIFGARLTPESNDQIRVMSIVTGVTPKFSQAPRMNEGVANAEFLAGIDRIY